jgi:hypothetical protein
MRGDGHRSFLVPGDENALEFDVLREPVETAIVPASIRFLLIDDEVDPRPANFFIRTNGRERFDSLDELVERTAVFDDGSQLRPCLGVSALANVGEEPPGGDGRLGGLGVVGVGGGATAASDPDAHGHEQGRGQELPEREREREDPWSETVAGERSHEGSVE